MSQQQPPSKEEQRKELEKVMKRIGILRPDPGPPRARPEVPLPKIPLTRGLPPVDQE